MAELTSDAFATNFPSSMCPKTLKSQRVHRSWSRSITENLIALPDTENVPRGLPSNTVSITMAPGSTRVLTRQLGHVAMGSTLPPQYGACVSIAFEGGPISGDELHGLNARGETNALGPPFLCFNVDGRWEHYVWISEERYEWTAPCHRLAGHDANRHPDCGYDHTSSW